MADAGGSVDERIARRTPRLLVEFVSLITRGCFCCFGEVNPWMVLKHGFVGAQKIKDELIMLGFMSLVLGLLQNPIRKICISEQLARKWLPCKKTNSASATSTVAHFLTPSVPLGGRHVLVETFSTHYCTGQKGTVPLLSPTALHHLSIFIFALAISHVLSSSSIILCGQLKINKCKHWEDERHDYSCMGRLIVITDGALNSLDNGVKNVVPGWLHSFVKQIYGSVIKSDYIALRRNLIRNHGDSDLKFSEYIMNFMENNAEFKEVVGIHWYLWLLVAASLLLNITGWHAYFWISFIPLTLLFAIGTKLEHIMGQLTLEHIQNEDNFRLQMSLLLHLINISVVQNSFQLAFFFFILCQYGFNSCIMGEVGYVIPRLIIGLYVMGHCGLNILPLYAIMNSQITQMRHTEARQHRGSEMYNTETQEIELLTRDRNN